MSVSSPPLSSCAELVRRGDPDRFFSAMTAPPAFRERLFALYAFNLELARVSTLVSEPMLGAIRLQWWRETIELAFDGHDRDHEVAAPLGEAIRGARLPREPFDKMIDARALDLEPAPFTDRPSLDAYLRDTGGALLELASRALSGEPGPADLAGFAFAAGNWLRAVPALRARGRRALPGEAAATGAQLARDALSALGEARREGAPKAAYAAYRAGWRAEIFLRSVAAQGFAPHAEPARLRDEAKRAKLLWLALTGRW